MTNVNFKLNADIFGQTVDLELKLDNLRLPSIEESADRINKVNEQVKDITDKAQAISKIHRGGRTWNTSSYLD